MALYKRGNRWYIDIYDNKGKRIRRPVRIKEVHPDKITKKQALEFEKIIQGKVTEGLELPSNKKEISFKKLVSEYLKWCDDNHVRSDRDHTACKNLLGFFKGCNASKINLWLVERYKKQRKELGRKARTINIELATLRHMYNKSIEFNLLTESPIKGLKLLKQEVKEINVLGENEFQRLYNSSSEHFRPVLLFAYFTGCRKSEIRLLKWENVNIEDGYVLITNTKNYEERTIFLNNILKDILKNLKVSSNSAYVFTYKNKPYKSRSAWRKSWETALKKSGVKKCTGHDLRHSFISNLIVNEGVDFETVMSLSGHKSVSMLKRYTHTNKNAKQEAVKKLEKYINIENNGHNLVTKPVSRKNEESVVISLSN